MKYFLARKQHCDFFNLYDSGAGYFYVFTYGREFFRMDKICDLTDFPQIPSVPVAFSSRFMIFSDN